jgi:prepilin-type N-terminal cleavage/methylation domain-containing protein
MMLQSRYNEGGFSLVEVILAMVLMGVMMGVIASAYVNWSSIGNRSQQVLQRQNELQTALNRIIEGTSSVPGLLKATSVTTSGASSPCGGSSTLTYMVGGKTISYEFKDNSLEIKVDSGDSVPILSSLTCFSARLHDTDSSIVLLRLEAHVKGMGGGRTVELATQVKPRMLNYVSFLFRRKYGLVKEGGLGWFATETKDLR